VQIGTCPKTKFDRLGFWEESNDNHRL